MDKFQFLDNIKKKIYIWITNMSRFTILVFSWRWIRSTVWILVLYVSINSLFNGDNLSVVKSCIIFSLYFQSKRKKIVIFKWKNLKTTSDVRRKLLKFNRKFSGLHKMLYFDLKKNLNIEKFVEVLIFLGDFIFSG